MTGDAEDDDTRGLLPLAIDDDATAFSFLEVPAAAAVFFTTGVFPPRVAALGSVVLVATPTGAVEGRDGVCLQGTREPVVVAAAAAEVVAEGLVLPGEARGSLLADLAPPPEAVATVVAAREVVAVVVGLEGVVFVGVVLEGREGVLEEERAVRAFTGRSPLVDLLSRSEIGATRRQKVHLAQY